MSTDYTTDFFIHIGEIRETLQTLVERGKPVSVADLQALIASVEAKSNPTLTFPADEAARLLASKLPPLLPKPTFPATELALLLVPKLLPLMPTPVELVKAGEQASASIKSAIAAGSQSSVQQVVDSMQESSRQFNKAVQESSQQLTAAAATLNKAAESVPRSVTVDFLQGWRWPTGLAVVPVLLVLLGLRIAGAFSGVEQTKYDKLEKDFNEVLQRNKNLSKSGNFYGNQIEEYIKKYPKSARYFPKYEAPVAPAPGTE